MAEAKPPSAAAAGKPGKPGKSGKPGEEKPPTEEELKKIEEDKIRAEEERIQEEEERIRKEEERIRREEREKKRLEDEQKRKEEDERKRIEAAHLRMLTEAAEEEISGLKTENNELQRRVCTLQKKRRSVNAEQFILEGQEAYYQARLTNWTEKKLEFKRIKEQYDTKIDTLRDKLQEKQNECDARHEGMIHYFWKTARNSQDIVSRQRIPRHTLKALEQEERDTIAEMQVVRLRRLQLKSQLAKLEYKLEMKDQLQLDTGNLHAVDYEQLKMENESLNAKIHLKNEALSVLKKKTQYLVHTLTHVREKLQFLVVGCKVDGESLSNDDKALHVGRIKLSMVKTSIVSIRRKKEGLQKNLVTITSPMMLDDMDYQSEDIEAEEKNLEAMKKRYQELNVKIEENTKKAYSLGVIPKPTKTKTKKPPLERGNLRWGIRREVLGQMVVGDMVDQMAEQVAAKLPCLST